MLQCNVRIQGSNEAKKRLTLLLFSFFVSVDKCLHHVVITKFYFHRQILAFVDFVVLLHMTL